MTVILVLLTFLFFLLADHFVSHNTVVISQPAIRPALPTLPTEKLINGFRLPENLSYHPGHTWALAESPSLVRVGIDEFASKLLGTVESIVLPPCGTWVRQGHKFATITRDGKTVDLMSPIEGTVSEINPEGINKAPYGEGWLMTVQSPDLKTNFRNLIHGAVAKWWIEASAKQFSPATAQDGGEVINNFAGAAWHEKATQFLLN